MNLQHQEQLSLNRNEHGVLNIQTNNEQDFYFAMGYAHATDRSVQMLLMRILGQGRACELLMDNDEMLGIDEFFRKMNWSNSISREVQKFDFEELKLVQSYCDGVNSVILKKRPLEFKLIGYRPTPWTIEDAILISRMVGYVSLAQSQGEIERFALQMIQNGVPEKIMHELFPEILEGCDFDLIKQLKFTERTVPDGIKWLNMISAAIASNNWVVNGDKTQSVHAILANDPHLETNRLPNIWYELQLSLKDRYFIGCTMPGMPACLIGRTNDLSWGATYTFMDAIDSWMENIENGKYLKDEQRYAFEKRTEIIKRKKKEDKTVVFYENEHGVLDGHPSEDGYYLCSRWASDQTGHQSVQSVRRMFHATSVEEGMSHIGQLEPSFNWVLADTQGNVGYQMSGRMPVRNSSWNGFYPAPGWDSNFDWKGYETYDRLPRSFNPSEGYFITCNQDLNAFGKAHPINIAMGDYRFRRIQHLIQDRKDLTVDDFMKIQNDVYSIQAAEIMPLILPFLGTDKHSECLKNWNFEYALNEHAPVIFEEIYHALIRQMLEDQIGEKATDHLLKDTGILADFYLNFDQIIHRSTAHWFSKTSRDQMIQKAITSAKKIPLKTWGEINSFTMTNMFFGGKMPKILGFDKGPYGLKGGRATVHQGQIYRSAERQTSFTPSYRMVTDMGTNELHSSLAGGASGNRFSKFYANEIQAWLTGKYKTLKG